MKVHGLSQSSSGLQHIENRKAADAPAKKLRKNDIVELSRAVKNPNSDLRADLNTTMDLPVRTDRVRNAEQLIAKDTYNNPEFIEALAEKILESPPVNDIVTLIENDRAESTNASAESLEKAESQVRQDFYNKQSVMEEIAGRLIDTLGFSALF